MLAISVCLLTVLLVSKPGMAEPDLIGSDMGISSSASGNNIFEANEDDTPSPPPPKLSPAEAADLVRRKVGGQVMSVSTQQNDSGVVYGVKVLSAGRMRVIRVDGQNGQLLNP
ncbi:PepSY domain-containing protein [Cellvibrio sp. pealriver]|uniref:PepSY domain-containing protein n=1 Tax=Cellvibrio sp. pealriver TaxID=1622269 RepID=UPI00066FE8AB|nr:hypothetical protein [Cellvibrio sp. pealriver]